MELDHNSHSVFLLYYHLVMVVNCGSCFAAEQFVRHQVGAKTF